MPTREEVFLQVHRHIVVVLLFYVNCSFVQMQIYHCRIVFVLLFNRTMFNCPIVL